MSLPARSDNPSSVRKSHAGIEVFLKEIGGWLRVVEAWMLR
ncbi:MAG: hypothetical protein M0Z84_07615 [Gammaproteobacteria bacterium]|nr:hypothetical protein [Gammaproteobacteria bacterium]